MQNALSLTDVAASGSRMRGWLAQHGTFAAVGLLALGLVVAAYANHFDNGFHFDDSHVIENNLYIRSLGNAPLFFRDADTYTSLPENASYRPLVTLSFALDYWAATLSEAVGLGKARGLVPRQFHYTQFALHLLVGALVFVVVRRVCELAAPSGASRWVALFAAVLFTAHTANTETVNYLSCRTDVLATLAILAGFAIWLAWPRLRWTQLYLLPVLAGALAKPLTVMFAPILFVLVLLFDEGEALSQPSPAALARALWRTLRRTLPALAVGSIAAYLFLRHMEGEKLSYADTRPLQYAIAQPFVWLHYLRLFLLPRGLTADTDLAAVDFTWYDTRLLGALSILAALGVAGVACARRRELRPIAFGLAWFALALIPTSSVLPFAEVYNEHRIYTPYVGLALALAWVARVALARLDALGRRPLVSAAGALLALALLAGHAAGTRARNEVWRDDLSLWADVAQKSPRNGRGLMNYGLALMQRGRLDEALVQYELAKRHWPYYAFIECNLAICKSKLGRRDEAEPHFERALELRKDFALGMFFYASWMVEQGVVGRAPEAVALLERALAISPGDTGVRSLLCHLYVASGRRDAALGLAQQTLAHAPDDATARAYAAGRIPFGPAEDTAVAHAELARVWVEAGRFYESAVVATRAIDLDPAVGFVWGNLGLAQLRLGFREAALSRFERALDLVPGDVWTLQRLGEAR